jgi:hypothetical protein
MSRRSSGKRRVEVRWLDKPEKDNYPAALSYLSLTFDSKEASRLVDKLEEAEIEKFQAKDIFRASQLPLLDANNFHVASDLAKLNAGKPLSPLLLVRMPKLAKVIVADGYHRLCAVYSIDEDAVIPCRIL